MIGVIFNPTARGNKARHFREQVARLGAHVRAAPTQRAGDGRRLAAELVRDGADIVVAAGGDGTVNEVLNGLCDVEGGRARTRLGVLPLGTVNVIAKELGLSRDFHRAWAIIEAGRERLVDLPHARFVRPDGTPDSRYFALMAGTGLSARAIEKVNWALKVRFGPLAYVWAGVEAMRPPHPVIEVISETGTHRAELAEVGMGQFFGGRYVLFPGAQLDDGELDVTLAPRVSWPVLVRVFLRLLTRRLEGSRDVTRFRARHLTLTSTDPVPFHLDGDVVGTLPARIQVERQALRLVVP